MIRHAERNSFCCARMDCILFRCRELGSILSISSLFHKFHILPAPLQALCLDTALFPGLCCYVFENSKSRCRAPPTVTIPESELSSWAVRQVQSRQSRQPTLNRCWCVLVLSYGCLKCLQILHRARNLWSHCNTVLLTVHWLRIYFYDQEQD